MKKYIPIHKAILSVLLLSACTSVELCDDVVHPHVAAFSATFDWGDYAQAKSEQMYLLTTRILNTRHDVFLMNSDGKFLIKETKDTETAPIVRAEDDPVTPPLVYKEENSVSLFGGEYFMLAFTNPAVVKVDQDKPDKVQLVNLNEFKDDEAVGINQVAMRHTDTRPEVELGGKRWEDLNPGYGYVSEPGIPLYVARCEYLELFSGKQYAQSFAVKPLTMLINLEFSIDMLKDDKGESLDVAEKDVVVELSGIIPQISLSTGNLKSNEVKKMIMQVHEVSRQTTEEGTTINYRTTLNAFGLMGGIDYMTVSGPGIFRIGAYLEYGGKKRVVRVVANLSEQINRAGLTAATDKPNERIRLKDEVTLNIETHLRLKTSVVESADNTEGIGGWTPDADIDIEI